jgi:hypothetical protein
MCLSCHRQQQQAQAAELPGIRDEDAWHTGMASCKLAQGDFAEQDVTILLELSRTDNTTPVEKGK